MGKFGSKWRGGREGAAITGVKLGREDGARKSSVACENVWAEKESRRGNDGACYRDGIEDPGEKESSQESTTTLSTRSLGSAESQR